VQEEPTRHLALTVRDAAGAVLLATADDEPLSAPLSWLVHVHRALLPAHEPAPLSWRLPRDGGQPWTVTVAVSHESERAEAVTNLAALLGLGALGSVALLLVMGWNVHRSFRSMRSLLRAIAALRDDDARALRTLPPMPIGELQAIAGALRELADALEATERQRRVLSQQVLTLQEDERRRIARELHDEFGQRLTALRADVAWLQRQPALEPRAASVVAGMAAACASLHDETRQLLTSLQPLGAGDRLAPSHLLKLQSLLEHLVAGWRAGAERAARVELQLRARERDGTPCAWPDASDAAEIAIPHALVLTLYRISQEALTNVVRHAQATQAMLQLTLVRAGDRLEVEWQVSDDGVGLESLEGAQQRGNGLAGIRERVWAFGGDLHCAPEHVGSAGRPGLILRALFQFTQASTPELHEPAAAT
jgi:two-component system sensor histidine kinase UhpB